MAPRYLFERQIINLQSTLNAPCKNNLWTKPGRYKKENSVPYVTGLDWVRHLTRHDLQPHYVCYSSYAGKWCNWSEFFEMVCCGMTLKKSWTVFHEKPPRFWSNCILERSKKFGDLCFFVPLSKVMSFVTIKLPLKTPCRCCLCPGSFKKSPLTCSSQHWFWLCHWCCLSRLRIQQHWTTMARTQLVVSCISWKVAGKKPFLHSPTRRCKTLASMKVQQFKPATS